MPRKGKDANTGADACDVDLPMALKVLEDLLGGRLLIYPADLHKRHGGKREAWYKVCAMMAAPGVEWLAVAATTKDKAYRAGPKCFALGDSAIDGVMREHDHIVESVCKVGESLRALDAERNRIRRAREDRDQPRLINETSGQPEGRAEGQIAQRWAISGTDTKQHGRKEVV